MMPEAESHKTTKRRLISVFESLGWEAEEEPLVPIGSEKGFGDVVVRKSGHSRLLEIENESARRVYKDLLKGMSFDSLWVIAPNVAVLSSVRSKLRTLGVVERHPWLAVFTVPAAVEAAYRYDSLFFP